MKQTDLQGELARMHAASFGWALLCCNHRRDEAEEVLQTTYLKVMEEKAMFHGRSSLRTWLFGVIRRTAAEQRRRRWLRLQIFDHWPAGSIACNRPEYLLNTGKDRVFPGQDALRALAAFGETFPELGLPAEEELYLLDAVGSPATVRSNDPRYFGFVIGASLPAAAAAERLMLAWDQCASSFDNSPVATTLEQIAARRMLDALDLLLRLVASISLTCWKLDR